MGERVCAVIVTHNRKEILLECLEAILAQTYPLDQILIIDNASNDGTPELLRQRGYLDQDTIQYLLLTTNIGGAGGFHRGMKLAYEHRADWIWVMDDDSIPTPDALRQLFSAYQKFDIAQKPLVLTSKAVWIDGTLHPMNIPQVKVTDPARLITAAQHATVSIRYATFVALLLHRSAIQQYGLPLADYFIWSDDIEYTARILRNEFGVLVPDSIVVHKTNKKYTHMDDVGSRYYYHIRNNIWMLSRSRAWSKKEKIKNAIFFLRKVPMYLIRSKSKIQSIQAVFLGIRDGCFKAPKA